MNGERERDSRFLVLSLPFTPFFFRYSLLLWLLPSLISLTAILHLWETVGNVLMFTEDALARLFLLFFVAIMFLRLVVLTIYCFLLFRIIFKCSFEGQSHYTTITDSSANGLSCSPMKSPLIRNAYHQITLRPEGSPLLSDYMTEGSASPTSTSSSIQHFYERPNTAQQQGIKVQSTERNTSGVQYSLHHLNIPLTSQVNEVSLPPPLPPERSHHRLLLQHRMQTLQHHGNHHHFREYPTGSSQTSSHVSSQGLPQSLQPLRQLIAEASQQHPHLQPSFHSNAHHTVYRSLTRNNRSRFEYSDFYPWCSFRRFDFRPFWSLLCLLWTYKRING